MDSQKLSNRIQIITGITLVAGIALVIWELHQSQQVARAQITSDSFAQLGQLEIALLGEQPGEILAKACSDPGSLTDGELVVMFYLYKRILNLNLRMYFIEERSDLYEDDWRRFVHGHFALIFSTPLGRAWWHYEAETGAEHREIGDAYLATLGPPNCLEQFDLVRRNAVDLTTSYDKK